MSFTARRRRRTCDGRTTAAVDPPPPSIPIDLLLEILDRSDARTIVRCAAACKSIRSALLDPAFRRRLALRATANDGDAILLGVSYVFRDTAYSTSATGVGQLPRRHCSRFDAGLLGPFEPVAWCGSLVILRRRVQENFDFEMRACNALTGRASRLPSPGHVRAKFPYALLAAGDADGSFRLLVADLSLRTQIFSSEDGEWGAVVETHLPPDFPHSTPKHGSYPLVLGGTAVHWLYGDWPFHVVALDVGTARATLIKLPRYYSSKISYLDERFDTPIQLAASADGRLSLLVAKPDDISMWTLSAAAPEPEPEEARWTRTMVMDRQVISRDGRGWLVRFLGFGERTGIMILQLDGVGLLKINMGSKKAQVFNGARKFKQIGDSDVRLCLHETDLCSLLQAMRLF